jgi:prepilin-type processing-associated H-X9-DG protein
VRATQAWNGGGFGARGLTSYVGVSGLETYSTALNQAGLIGLFSKIRSTDCQDGMHATIMVAERPASPDLFWGWWSYYQFDAYQGAQQTFRMYGNIYSYNCPNPAYYGPGNPSNYCDFNHYWSFHNGGANFCFGDGHVQFVPYSASLLIGRLATRSGNEVVNTNF